MPSSDSDDRPGRFDKFADAADRLTSKSWFFFFCCALVVAWIPTNFFLKDINTAQLLINTPTTILTFLMLGNQQNTNWRNTQAVQKKNNAIAAFLAGDTTEKELREAVGLEERESSQ